MNFEVWTRGFEVAREVSYLSQAPTYGKRMGAALYSGPRLLSVGCNLWKKSTPLSAHTTHYGNVHAEMNALGRRKYYDRNNNLILYVARVTTDEFHSYEKMSCSRPCNVCMRIIRDFGVKRVRFYNENNQPEEIRF